MKVWVARRRLAGVAVPLKYSIGVGAPDLPLELIVKNVTDQGMRRPGKVARLYAPGGPMAVAELVQPRLFWMRKNAFVLGGVERQRNSYQQIVGFSQSWVCRLAPPVDLHVLRVLEMANEGIPLSSAQLRDRIYRGWTGVVEMGFTSVPQLGRLAKVAKFSSGGGVGDRLLLDVELEWMSEDRFELSGASILFF